MIGIVILRSNVVDCSIWSYMGGFFNDPLNNIDISIIAQYDAIVSELFEKFKKENKNLVGPNPLVSSVQECEKYSCQMREALLKGMKEMDRFKDAMHSFQGNNQAFLSREEQVQLEDEVKALFLQFSTMQFPENAKDKTIQNMLGISDFILYCLYAVGYGLSQQKLYSEAANIFFMLTVINPLVKDYWMALGFSAKACADYEKAASAFTMGTLMDDNDPLPYLYSVECFLALGNRSDAEMGFQDAIEMINKSENPERWNELLHAVKLKMDG